MNKYFPILLIIFSAFWVSCAQIGSPTGGPTDSIAPVIVKSKPVFNDTGFTDDELVIKFDEFFQYSNINSEFFSSPPFIFVPDFSISGKKMIVKLNENLKDTTTYTFYFGNSVQDFTESNPIEDFTYVFSTGPVIDSFSIAGYVHNALSLEKSKSVFVMLYKTMYDSVPYNETPYFVSKTDTSGYFFIRNIKHGDYKIFALNDMNTNMLYDMPNESVGFLDTNICATVKKSIKVDTLKNKSYIYDSLNVAIIDSVLTDSIVENIFYEYSPDNLQIFLFDEDNKKQFISDAVRAKKGKVEVLFNKELSETFEIKPINFKSENPIIETFSDDDSIIYWITDNGLIDLDTFKIEFSYLQKDSLQNIFLDSDTVFLVFENDDSDSLYLGLSTNLNDDFDLYDDIFIETSSPLKNIDTTKIRLYELIDSVVLEDKTQKILKAERLQKDLLVFTFSRSLVNEPKIVFQGIDYYSEYYNIFINDDRDSVVVTITNEELINSEILNFQLHYDNNYFFEQYQTFIQNFSLKISDLKLIAKNRNKVSEINLYFNKNLINSFKIEGLNFETTANWYNSEISGNIFKINILDSQISDKDTLVFSLKSLDYIDFNGVEIFYEDTISVILEVDKQEIVDNFRDLSSHFVLEFKNPLTEEPKLQLVNSDLNYWYRSDYSANSKVINYEIFHNATRNLKEINIVVNYIDKDKYGNNYQKQDTLKLTVVKNPNIKSEDSIYVTIEFEHIFEIEQDTSSIRKYIFDFIKKPNTKYKLKIDSMAFNDIYDFYNDSLSSDFKTRGIDYYGSMSLNLTNIGVIQFNNIELEKLKNFSDSLLVETKLDNISEGQAILSVLNSDEDVLYEFNIKESQNILLENLLPQAYYIKVIYDKNNNGKWDTGNYLQKIQPEKVFYYTKSVVVQSGFETQVDWEIETY